MSLRRLCRALAAFNRIDRDMERRAKAAVAIAKAAFLLDAIERPDRHDAVAVTHLRHAIEQIAEKTGSESERGRRLMMRAKAHV